MASTTRPPLRLLVKDSIRSRDIVERRIRGESWYQISDALKIKPVSARHMFRKELERYIEDHAEEVAYARQLEIERLDKLWATWYPKATAEVQPNGAAAQLCLQILKQRAAITGIEAPKALQVNHAHLHLTKESLDIAARMTSDPLKLAALEDIAAAFAHGEDALEGDYYEAADELGPGAGFPDEATDPVVDQPDDADQPDQGGAGHADAEDDR